MLVTSTPSLADSQEALRQSLYRSVAVANAVEREQQRNGSRSGSLAQVFSVQHFRLTLQ
jgi:hypothetical protein